MSTATIQVAITAEMVSDLLTTALEGDMSRAWIGSAKAITDWRASNPGAENVVWWGNPAFWANPNNVFEIKYEDPNRDHEGEHSGKMAFTVALACNRLAAVVSDHPDKWFIKDWLDDNLDANSADCIVQMLVLDDIVFG
ncbi:MAG: hypothetical protein NXI16_01450 [Alphaproteobacteria bacterium]|nr:hypothetical protein [Alphaproteobacteria bacterium]